MHLLTSSPSSSSGLPAAILSACQHRISELWGLHFPPERWRDLVRHLRGVADALNISLTACVDGLLNEPPQPEIMDVCVREFTVGETYFLRDPDFFSQLRRASLVPLVERRRRAQDFRLRFWSAGCCTGEEAYTLAILLRDLLPDPENWRIDIIATDINPAFLSKARKGQFSNWSFRQVNDGWRQRHFVKEANRWRINDAYRNTVRFVEHNLVDACYPDSAQGLNDCDVILCRNVLMYFNPVQAASVLQRMLTCLSSDGVFFLAPAEGLICQAAGLLPELWPGALCLKQTSGQKSTGSVASSIQAPPVSVAWRTVEPEIRTPQTDTIASDAESNPELQAQASMVADKARAYANQHQLQEALDWLEQAIALNRLDPALYWLQASLQIEQGARPRALSTLRKAIYLQPDFVMAHYVCGLLSAGIGESFNAERDLKNCVCLLERLADTETLPESEGLSVKDLKHLVRDALGKIRDGR